MPKLTIESANGASRARGRRRGLGRAAAARGDVQRQRHRLRAGRRACPSASASSSGATASSSTAGCRRRRARAGRRAPRCSRSLRRRQGLRLVVIGDEHQVGQRARPPLGLRPASFGRALDRRSRTRTRTTFDLQRAEHRPGRGGVIGQTTQVQVARGRGLEARGSTARERRSVPLAQRPRQLQPARIRPGKRLQPPVRRGLHAAGGWRRRSSTPREALRKSVLDAVLADMTRSRRGSGRRTSSASTQHMANIRAIENRLTPATPSCPPGSPACVRPAQPAAPPTVTERRSRSASQRRR